MDIKRFYEEYGDVIKRGVRLSLRDDIKSIGAFSLEVYDKIISLGLEVPVADVQNFFHMLEDRGFVYSDGEIIDVVNSIEQIVLKNESLDKFENNNDKSESDTLCADNISEVKIYIPKDKLFDKSILSKNIIYFVYYGCSVSVLYKEDYENFNIELFFNDFSDTKIQVSGDSALHVLSRLL